MLLLRIFSPEIPYLVEVNFPRFFDDPNHMSVGQSAQFLWGQPPSSGAPYFPHFLDPAITSIHWLNSKRGPYLMVTPDCLFQR